MANEVLQGIANDLVDITKRIEEAKTLIEVMREAGEDVAKLKADLRDQETRKIRWERVLESRGIKPK